jgi:hypothetical protein
MTEQTWFKSQKVLSTFSDPLILWEDFGMTQPIFCDLKTTCFSFQEILVPWPLTLKNNRHLPLIMVNQLVNQVVWIWHFQFDLCPAYNIFFPSDAMALTFVLWLWKSKGSSFHQGDQMYQSWNLRFVQDFPSNWCYSPDLWPWNTIGIFLSSWWLYDPES